MFPEQDKYYFMQIALKEAVKAFDLGEVPVGAVVVKDNVIIGKGYNQVETLKDSTAHAEIIALTSAFNYLNDKYLTNCTLYVTVEPCVMCTGAIINSRINELVFGCYEPKFGACGSLYNIPENKKTNHSVKVYSGIMEDESSSLLKAFFREKRIK